MREKDVDVTVSIIPTPHQIGRGTQRHPLAALLQRLVEQSDPSLGAEGYRLEVDAQHAVVHAGGPRGFRHARATLHELAGAEGGTVPDLRIEDAPLLPRRGIIEGFYGEPWSHAERVEALRLAGRVKLNSYVYAPKDDPYHRVQWRDPYPPDQLARLADLAREGEENGVDVVVALHPTGSMVFADDAEHELLAAKARQLLEAGVPDIALLFDDVPPTPVQPADKERFGEDGRALGEAHALTARRLQQALRGLRPSSTLLVVPMDYAGVGASDYRVAFAAGLPDDVLVWWTGSDIVVGEIDRHDIDEAAAVFGDRLLLWDNFPVNDFDRGRAFLGPLLGRTGDVQGSALHGAWTNPMVEFVPGCFGIAAFADWAWNPAAYDPQRAARAARRIVAGPQARALAPLIETLSSWPPSATMDAALAALANAVLDAEAAEATAEAADAEATDADAGAADAEAAALRARLDGLRGLQDVDVRMEPARSLAPWLRAAVDVAAAGLAALDLLESAPGATTEHVEAALARAEAHTVKVAVDVIPAFVRSVLERRTAGQAVVATDQAVSAL